MGLGSLEYLRGSKSIEARGFLKIFKIFKNFYIFLFFYLKSGVGKGVKLKFTNFSTVSKNEIFFDFYLLKITKSIEARGFWEKQGFFELFEKTGGVKFLVER